MNRVALACSLLAILATTGCFHHRSQDVVTRMPLVQPDGAEGAIDVVLSSPSRGLTVAVDGALVADNAHARRVHVDHVPAGVAHVRVVIDGRCERGGFIDQDVEVVPGGTTAVALPGPSHEHACMAITTAVHVALAVTLVRPVIHLVRALARG